MRMLLPGILLLFSASELMALSPQKLTPDAFPSLPAGQEIHKSIVKKGDNLGLITVIGRINASPDEVYGALTDSSKVQQLFPKIKKNEVRMKKGNLYHFYSELVFPFPLQDRWSLNETVFHPGLKAIEWRRIDGSIRVNEGAWRLFPDGEGTLMIYQVRFDPGLPLVPDWLIEYGMKQEAPSIIVNLRSYFKNRQTASRG
ncbi:MAG: SRPBCC family protein [Leptospiraceae bacterium]|nr:SRPBCC family protein [Leptospiraceae bacterium]